jgi:diguanylate cyclase (GGDEF)-like protein/PAS domain S-box-containing protein
MDPRRAHPFTPRLTRLDATADSGFTGCVAAVFPMAPSSSHPEDRQPVEQDVERRFRTLVESIPGVVAYMDLVHPDDPAHSTPVYISPQIEAMLGYPRDAWMNEDELWLTVIHPDDAERMTLADSAARGSHEPLFAEYRMIARDGRVVWVSEKASVVRDAGSGTVYWLGVMVDITDRKRTEEALAASESQFRSVFDAATIGVLTIDLDGVIVEANRTLAHVCRYPAGALDGRRLGDLLDPSDPDRGEWFRHVSTGAVDRCEIEHRILRHDQVLMWVRTVAALVRDGRGFPLHVTAMVEDIDDRKLRQEALVHRSLHDNLTGLPNRGLFIDRLEQAQARQRLERSSLAVVFLDMDGFKQINDSLGHAAGDELLIAVARRLNGAIRPTDTVARYAGDEFLALLEGVGTDAEAVNGAERLAAAIRAPYVLDGRTVQLSASTGVYRSENPDEAAGAIIRNADSAMYSAKRRGANRIHLFGDGPAQQTAA